MIGHARRGHLDQRDWSASFPVSVPCGDARLEENVVTIRFLHQRLVGLVAHESHGVLHGIKVVFVHHGQEGLHVAGNPGAMDRHDGLGARVYLFPYRLDIKIERVRLDLGEDRSGSPKNDGIGGGYKVEAGLMTSSPGPMSRTTIAISRA